MSDVREFTEFAIHLSRLAGREISKYFRASFAIDDKSSGANFDPVTIADRNAETVIRQEIKRVYPAHGLLGEEHGLEAGSSRYTWVIDPIDGTRSFVLGQLHWGTLIALNDGTRPIVGVMHQPFIDETFVGSSLGGEVRYRGDTRPLRSRRDTKLEDAIVCATSPTMFSDPQMRARFERVASHARSVRYGGDCYTPCLVAAGHADLVIEASLRTWDVQALVPIVESAGGVITDWNGGDVTHANQMIVAGNAQLHREVLDALSG